MMCAKFINLGKVLHIRSKSGRLSGAWRGLEKGVQNLRCWWCSIVDCWCEPYFLMDTKRMWSETDRSNEAGPWRCDGRRVVQKLADSLRMNGELLTVDFHVGGDREHRRCLLLRLHAFERGRLLPWTDHSSGRGLWQEATTSVTRLKPIMQQWGESGSCCLELQRIVFLGRANMWQCGWGPRISSKGMNPCLGEFSEPVLASKELTLSTEREGDVSSCHPW